MLRAIAAMKLVKAAILIAVSIGAFRLIGRDAAAEVRQWSHALHMHGRYVDEIVAKVGGLDETELATIGVGTMVYAALFVVEGIGLWRRQVWAEYMTLVVTLSFVPFEIYETVQKTTPTRIATILINILVVLYLIRRLAKAHHWPFRKRQPALP